MADYVFDIDGSSNLIGFNNIDYGIPTIGSSTSYGSAYDAQLLILGGSSNSTGLIDDIPFGGGISNSAGYLDIVYDYINGGISESTGFDSLARTILTFGYSNSLGRLDYKKIAALVNLACYILNMDTKRTYQFSSYDFHGIGRFNGKTIGARNNNIYDLETPSTKDDNSDISAYMEITTDFGIPNDKGIRSIYVEDDNVKITISDEYGRGIAYNITPKEFRGLPRDLVSKFFTIKIENIAGQQIMLRRVYGKLNILKMKGV